jgi:UDP-N-acetylmuramyl-tripeptide synthetase
MSNAEATRRVMLGTLVAELLGSPHARIEVTGISLDSRRLRPGDMFLAVRGEHHDGVAFLHEAQQRGASVALVDETADVADELAFAAMPVVRVARLRERLSEIAAGFHDSPSRSLAVIGVTGTNGKTTVSQLIAQAFTMLDAPCAVIGTIGWGFTEALQAASHTTPDAITLQAMLASLRARGATRVAMEVSSHALKQGRARAVLFDTAIFTNLTHDHLDYHGSFEDYGASKALLFRSAGLRNAIVNVDDAFGRDLLGSIPQGVRILGYGIGATHADVHAQEPQYSAGGLSARVSTPWGDGLLAIPLLGRFNLGNALAVLGALCLHGIDLPRALDVCSRLRPVAGRMQRVSRERGPMVIVDYAHTPDALEQTLRALRQHCSGRLFCVFGCGGDRDRAKRPLMGRIAWEHADEILITSDNPRGENPAAIIDETSTGIPDPHVLRQPDRALAIQQAIASARPGDCVLIAGKGHEDYQEIAGQRIPFNDVAIAQAALNGWSVPA